MSYYDSPVGQLINCKMRGLLVTMPEPLGKKSLKKKYVGIIDFN